MPQPVFADHRQHVDAIVRAAIAAADPVELMARDWPRSGLSGVDGPIVVGAGKAAAGMFRGLVERCGVRPSSGVIVVPPGQADQVRTLGQNVDVFEADHPLPTERNVVAAKAVAGAAQRAAAERRALIVLLSGGGSAHLTWPVAGLTLDDLRALTTALLRSGANIDELNCVRKHCEVLKGGGLARLAYPAPVCVLILSDVLGDRAETIASGPTMPDPTSSADALGVLERFHVEAAVPIVAAHLRRCAGNKTPGGLKPGNREFSHTRHIVIGNNQTAMNAAVRAAEALAFRVVRVSQWHTGDSKTFALALARWLKQARHDPRKAGAVILGGEPTVEVRGSGLGGRSQELALWAAWSVAGEPRRCLGSFATDGIDGPTDAAGAFVTGETVAAAARLGLDAAACLENNDSHTFFSKLEAAGVSCLIRTGPTGTNVNDVMFGLAYQS